jgi:putative endonuclease
VQESPRALGDWGEDLAACFLQGMGYEIVSRNQRLGPVEIDLLVRCGETLAIVEVRLRSGTARGRPEETVSPRKRRTLLRAWRQIAASHPEARVVRMDILAIELDGRRRLSLRHYPHAWIPPGLSPF